MPPYLIQLVACEAPRLGEYTLCNRHLANVMKERRPEERVEFFVRQAEYLADGYAVVRHSFAMTVGL